MLQNIESNDENKNNNNNNNANKDENMDDDCIIIDSDNSSNVNIEINDSLDETMSMQTFNENNKKINKHKNKIENTNDSNNNNNNNNDNNDNNINDNNNSNNDNNNNNQNNENKQGRKIYVKVSKLLNKLKNNNQLTETHLTNKQTYCDKKKMPDLNCINANIQCNICGEFFEKLKPLKQHIMQKHPSHIV